jgi:hypothetical protein
MRHRVRIQPYISVEVRRKLAASAVAQEVTESALTEAALVAYLEPDHMQEGVVLRRLDSLTQAIARLQDDLDILAQAFGRFAWYSFTVQPPEATPEGNKRGESLFRQLVEAVSNDLGGGMTLAGSVRRARAPRPSRPPGPGARGGQ